MSCPARSDASDAVGQAIRGYITCTVEGVGQAVAKLDNIIDGTNDDFEAFQAEAFRAEAENRAREEAALQQRLEAQNELDEIAKLYARPPYSPES
jgi:pyruvate-formate lyase